MSISSLNFIVSQFETEKYRYFAIYDEDGDLVFSQNELIDADRAAQKLKNFFKDNTGYFTIRIFGKKIPSLSNLASRDSNTIAKYNVEISTPVLPQGVNGLTGMGAMNGSVLPPDDPRQNAPNMFQLLGQMSQVEQQMKLMEKDHAHYRELKELQDKIAKMEEEQSKSRGMGAIVDRLGEQFSDPNVLLGLLSGVQQLFKPKAVVPMHGINDNDIMPMNGIDAQVEANILSRREKMVAAVNLLMKHDDNFPENISKLAVLAQNKPAIYSMAVNYLNNL
jgi:hypothetical protein